MSRLTVVAIVAFCVLGFNAKAEVFYWKKGYQEEGLYGSPENWEVETQENANARIPSETDEIFGAQHADWNFDGQTYTIGTWNSLVDRSGKADWNAYTINLTNGVFKVLNRRSHRDVINVMDGATLIFPEKSEYVASLNDGAIEYLYVKKGGRVEILGDFSPYKIHLYTERGGGCCYQSTVLPHICRVSSREQDHYIWHKYFRKRSFVFGRRRCYKQTHDDIGLVGTFACVRKIHPKRKAGKLHFFRFWRRQ